MSTETPKMKRKRSVAIAELVPIAFDDPDSNAVR
jgi:hypothetical protein